MRGSVTRYTIKGSIRPRWRYRVYVGKDEQGNKVWEGRGGFQKQAEANEALRLHIEGMQLRANTAVSSPGPVWTLDSWLQHWLNDYGPARCQPKTLERYRQLVRYIPDSLGEIPLSKLSHTDLESAFFALRKAPGKRRLHLSARTVHHVAGFVNVALNKAFRLAILSVNPMLRVELPPTERKDARALSPEEIELLRNVSKGDWIFALIELALACGARRGELLALTWADLDFLARSLTIGKSLEQTQLV